MSDDGWISVCFVSVVLALIIAVAVGWTKSSVLDKQIEWERQQTLRHCISVGRAPSDCKAMVKP